MEELHLQKWKRDIPDEELISDLKNAATKTGKTTITMEQYNHIGNFHASTLTRRFGSWFVCLERADLNDSRSRINISNEELFSNLKNVWANWADNQSTMKYISPFLNIQPESTKIDLEHLHLR